MDRLNPGKKLVLEFRLQFKAELNKIGLGELLDSTGQENQLPFCENESVIRNMAEDIKRSFIEKCREIGGTEMLPSLNAGMDIVLSSVLEENQKNERKARETVNTIVKMLTAIYESDFHNFLRPFSIDNSSHLSESLLKCFHDQKLQELLKKFDGINKPGDETFLQKFRMQLSSSCEETLKKILEDHQNQPGPTGRRLRKVFFGFAALTLGAIVVGVTYKVLSKQTSPESQLVRSLSKEVTSLKLIAIKQEELVADLIELFHTSK